MANMATAAVTMTTHSRMKKILAFDIPGLGSSLCSRGGSNVLAFGIMLVRCMISSCCGIEKKLTSTTSTTLGNLCTHTNVRVNVEELKAVYVMVIGQIARCGR